MSSQPLPDFAVSPLFTQLEPQTLQFLKHVLQGPFHSWPFASALFSQPRMLFLSNFNDTHLVRSVCIQLKQMTLIPLPLFFFFFFGLLFSN